MKLVKNDRDEALLVHYVMLTRQMTKLADCFTHIMRLPTQADGRHGHASLDFRGYRAFAQSELSDVLCQVKKLCDILELDFFATLGMGLVRDAEKRSEYQESHPGDQWI